MRTVGASRFPSHPAKRVSIVLGIRDHVNHRSLMVELLHRARQAKLAGATVFRAKEGFGRSGQIHRSHLLSDDASIVVVIVDRPEPIDAFLGDLAASHYDLLVVVEDIEVLEARAT